MRFGEVGILGERPFEQLDRTVELAEIVKMLGALEVTSNLVAHDNAKSR